MEEKSLIIKNFRNLGISEEGTKLLLAPSLKATEMGDLVILIGPNNSGKSNVLDAVELSGRDNVTISEDSRPDYIYENRPYPELNLLSINDKGSYNKLLTCARNPSFRHKINKYTAKDKKETEEWINKIKTVLPKINTFDIPEYIATCNNELIQNFDQIINFETYQTYKFKLLFSYIDSRNYSSGYYSRTSGNYLTYIKSTISLSEDECNALEELDKRANDFKSMQDQIATDYENEYGYNFVGKTIRYKETPLSRTSLSAPYNNWKSSPLLVSLFKKLGIEEETINNVYRNAREVNSRVALETFQEEKNKLLSSISEDFNRMYPTRNRKIEFKLYFDFETISFGMKVGKAPLNLEKQSTGFKWFFNLYFNFLFNNTLNPGDVLIMDEPATNLHIKGQEELRDFLKEFAIKHKITIIIATHSPFLVSADFFDELRVVVRQEEDAYIQNDFSKVNDPQGHDTIDPIVSAFTTRLSVLVDPNKRVVFVEGITDYNYLVTFKRLLGYDDLVFIPFNGVGAKGQIQKTISALLAIRKDPIVLVDGDKAGQDFVSQCNGKGITPVALTDIDPSFKEIEDVFDANDKSRFAISKSNKHSNASCVFKKNVLFNKAKVTATTKKNFDMILKYLDENI